MQPEPDEGVQDGLVLESFLRFLDRDMAAHPERLTGMPDALYNRLLAVTEGVEVTPDDPIEGPVAL